jgi:hypothetical protein
MPEFTDAEYSIAVLSVVLVSILLGSEKRIWG